jgi:hypothetical protein
MSLPTHEEINVHDSLDERHACKNFLGKTLEQAEAMFRESPLYYQEDLMWMGPVAFRFYVPALINYIQSSASKGDSDIVNCFAGVLEFRLEYERPDLVPIACELTQACRYIVDHHDFYELTEGISGDLPRYRHLMQEFISMKDQAV